MRERVVSWVCVSTPADSSLRRRRSSPGKRFPSLCAAPDGSAQSNYSRTHLSFPGPLSLRLRSCQRPHSVAGSSGSRPPSAHSNVYALRVFILSEGYGSTRLGHKSFFVPQQEGARTGTDLLESERPY